MARIRRPVFLALRLACVGAACASDAPDEVLQATLVDGRVLGDLIVNEGAALLLIYSPEECLSCSPAAGSWLAWARERGVAQVLLVLTRPPIAVEAEEIRRQRLPDTLRLGSRWGRASPSALLYTSGALVDSAFGRRAVERMYSRALVQDFQRLSTEQLLEAPVP